MSKKKKKPQQDTTSKVVLATAIIKLIHEILEIIKHFTE